MAQAIKIKKMIKIKIKDKTTRIMMLKDPFQEQEQIKKMIEEIKNQIKIKMITTKKAHQEE